MSIYTEHSSACPTYTGTDFWNDPHLWCGCDPTSVLCWSKPAAKTCSLVKTYTIRPQYWDSQRALQTQYAGLQQASQMALLQNLNQISGLAAYASPFGGLFR